MKKKEIDYALSLAAGWAWGVSLIVGMQTVQQKGILPFAIWAVANSLALPVFGFFAYRIKKLRVIIDSFPVQLFTTMIMIFCLLIQMNCIYDTLSQVFSPGICKAAAIAISLFMSAVLYHDGIIRNIKIDKPLWIICYAVLILLCAVGFGLKAEKNELVMYVDSSGIMWALNSCLILFAGPFMNIQNWQMAEKLNNEKCLEKCHFLAGLFFGIYMLLVLILSVFKFSNIMLIIQIAAIMCIACTTIDASIVGMQKIGGRKLGLIFALVTILCWRFFISMGVLRLWTFMGNIRKYVAGICVLAALIWQYSEKRKGSADE